MALVSPIFSTLVFILARDRLVLTSGLTHDPSDYRWLSPPVYPRSLTSSVLIIIVPTINMEIVSP